MKGYIHLLLTACLSLALPLAFGQNKGPLSTLPKGGTPTEKGPVGGNEAITPESRAELIRQRNVLSREGLTPAVVAPARSTPAVKTEDTPVKISSTPSPSTATPAKKSAATATKTAAPIVDERPLWGLLAEKRYDELDQAIARLQAKHPNWQPPARLAQLREETRRRDEISAATAAQDDVALIEFASLYPTEFDCNQVNNAWLLGRAYGRTGQLDKATEVYRGLLMTCSKPEDRLATLYKASEWVADDDFDRLAQLELTRNPRPPAVDEELRHFLYGRQIEVLVRYYEQGDQDQALDLADRLQDDTRQWRDAEGANLLGWVYYRAARYPEALAWFQFALEQDPTNADAAYGVALNQFTLGDVDAARSTVLNRGTRSVDSLDARSRALLGEIYFSKAVSAYQKRQFKNTDLYLDIAERSGKKDDSSLEMRAWQRYSTGHYQVAADMFEDLYRRDPTANYANGLALSLSQIGKSDRVMALQSELNGPLGAVQWAQVQDDFDRFYPKKIFLAAHAADPHRMPELENIDSPFVTLGGVYRERKSRDDSPMGLKSRRWPIIEGVFSREDMSFRVGVDQVHVSRTGDVGASFPIGHMPAEARRFDKKPTYSVDTYEPYIGFRKEGWLTIDATIGASARKKPLDQEIIWNVMLRQHTDFGYVQADIYRQPVRESLLSYTGMIDPYTGETWGQVFRLGGALSGFWQLQTVSGEPSPWGISGRVGFEQLKGTDVQKNNHVFGAVSVAKDLNIDGFDYFTVGPEISYQTYQKNLSHFTWGHGGYYSPKTYVNVGPAVNFLSDEGQSFIYKGRLSVGYAYSNEKSAPYFPGSTLLPRSELATGRYQSNTNSRAGVNAELLGVHQVSPYVQVGGGAAFAIEPEYKEYTGMLFVRLFFQPRRAAFSSDLAESMFRRAY